MTVWRGFVPLVVAGLFWNVVGCATDHRTPSLAKSHVEVDSALPAELRHSVEVLSANIGERNVYRPDNLARSADWIEHTLNSYGYEIHREDFGLQGQRFRCADQTVWNIIAELPGTKFRDQIIAIGAHYDSRVAMSSWHEHVQMLPDARGTPGANDNASGVAAVLAIAHQLAKQPLPKTVRFCFWVNEEPPFYHTTNADAMGSFVSASRSRSRGDDLQAVISFDAVGCYSSQPNTEKRGPVMNMLASAAGLPRRADYVAFLSLQPNEKLVDRCAQVYSQHSRIAVRTVVLPYVSPIVSWSDDWSYDQHHFPAFCITDTAFLRSDHYHELSDTSDHMDFQPFADVVWGAMYVVRDLASG